MKLAYNGNITDGVFLPVEGIGSPEAPIYPGDTIEVDRETGEALLSQTDVDADAVAAHPREHWFPSAADPVPYPRRFTWAPADAEAEQVVHDARTWLDAVAAKEAEADAAAAAVRERQAAVDAEVMDYRRELEAEADAARAEAEAKLAAIEDEIASKVAARRAEVEAEHAAPEPAPAKKAVAKKAKADTPPTE